jgi:S-formylglutathione hydrolase
MKLIESIKEFSGYLNRYEHESEACNCTMIFSVFLPKEAESEEVPTLYWLSGLTCTDDNVRTKAGMQRYAAEHGIALVFPDTSPRGEDVPDVAERYDLGLGAGFYLNASEGVWVKHYQMYDYVVSELPSLLEDNLPLKSYVRSISGHSMGGHGALVCALNNPDKYRSVSAFAPICNPVESDWGRGCFGAYLGNKQSDWRQYDATELVRAGNKVAHILIDQGIADEFYQEGQLSPENFEQACADSLQNLELRMQEGYDHSYHFIATFIGEHIAYHAKAMRTE